MLGMLVSFLIGILAGVTIMCVYQVSTINEYDKILDDMSEQLVGLSIWGENKEDIIILNTKEQVKKYFMKGE